MKLKLKWQRGSADLISVAVGMVILSVTVAGTAGAMIFGREAMIRQEHAKAAAFLLRGKMEEICGCLQVVGDSRDPYSSRSYLNSDETYRAWPIDSEHDRRGDVDRVMVTIHRDRVTKVNPLDKSFGYVVTVHASWEERDLVGHIRPEHGITKTLTFETAVIVPGEL